MRIGIYIYSWHYIPPRAPHGRAWDGHRHHARDAWAKEAKTRGRVLVRLREVLLRPHVPHAVPGRDGMARRADRPLPASVPRPGGHGPPLRAGDLRRAQRLPGGGRHRVPLPPGEKLRADEPVGEAALHAADPPERSTRGGLRPSSRGPGGLRHAENPKN